MFGLDTDVPDVWDTVADLLSPPPNPYLDAPVQWVRDKTDEHLTLDQRHICESVVKHRYTAVKSSHDVGKSYTASRIACWWIDAHPPGEAFVVTTAPTTAQVKAILWREIGKAHRKAGLAGRITGDGEWKYSWGSGPDELIAFGRKPADYDPSAFQGIHCLAEDHEILTRRGWLSIDEITESDEVLSVPCDGEVAEWMPITKVHRYPYKGDLNVYDGRAASFAVTDEHRFPMKNQWNDSEWTLKPVVNDWASWFLRRRSGWVGNEIEVPAPFAQYGWSPAHFAEFLGFWTGDGGTVMHHKTGRFYEVVLYQTKGDLSYVTDLLTETRIVRGKDNFRFSDRACAEWLVTNVGRYQHERRIPQFVLDGTPDILNAYADGFWSADGTTRPDGQRGGAYTTSRQLVDGLQELQIKLGVAGAIGINTHAGSPPRGASKAVANHDCYVIGWANGSADHEVKPERIQKIPYDGRVWCISTPHETFYTRRNGKVCISGNSRYVLVVIDEAGGVPKMIYDAVDALATNEYARVLAVGNPDDPGSHFAKVCKPGSGWNTMRINALESPNFNAEAVAKFPRVRALMDKLDIPPTIETVPADLRPMLVSPMWVDERISRWGVNSPLFTSKVLGDFPEVSHDALIEPGWILAAQLRNQPPIITDAAFGVDVARYGNDQTIISLREGLRVRILYESSKTSIPETVGQVIRAVDIHPARPVAQVDDVGVGGGVTDLLAVQGYDVRPMIGQARATEFLPNGKPKFVNKRSEWYWNLRESFRAGEPDIDTEDEELAAQLGNIKYGVNPAGQIYVESKDEMSKRGVDSPDRADSVCYAWVRGVYDGSDLAALDHHRGASLTSNMMSEEF